MLKDWSQSQKKIQKNKFDIYSLIFLKTWSRCKENLIVDSFKFELKYANPNGEIFVANKPILINSFFEKLWKSSPKLNLIYYLFNKILWLSTKDIYMRRIIFDIINE